jgi:hypothetical protein
MLIVLIPFKGRGSLNIERGDKPTEGGKTVSPKCPRFPYHDTNAASNS